MEPDEVTQVVKDSGLRGVGGAGFPTGLKWSFLPKQYDASYVVCNADESEPGAFKDRELMERNPHQLIEGCLLAAYAIKARHAFIYVRGEYLYVKELLDVAIADARAGGLLGEKIFGREWGCEIIVYRGAGAYICGEESAMLDSLEGYRGFPRQRPPFPRGEGPVWQAYSCEQCRNPGQRSAHRRARSCLVSLDGHREEPGPPRSARYRVR